MNEEKIGMYSIKEIYKELANGFLHHSMVDAMYFQIKDLQQKVEQLENIRKEVIEYIKSYKNDYAPYELSDYNVREILIILNKGDNKE